MTDLLEHLRELQESRYCFMPGIVRDAANEIVALRQQVKELEACVGKARHWAEHSMLMRSSQNKELLGILQGKPEDETK